MPAMSEKEFSALSLPYLLVGDLCELLEQADATTPQPLIEPLVAHLLGLEFSTMNTPSGPHFVRRRSFSARTQLAPISAFARLSELYAALVSGSLPAGMAAECSHNLRAWMQEIKGLLPPQDETTPEHNSHQTTSECFSH